MWGHYVTYAAPCSSLQFSSLPTEVLFSSHLSLITVPWIINCQTPAPPARPVKGNGTRWSILKMIAFPFPGYKMEQGSPGWKTQPTPVFTEESWTREASRLRGAKKTHMHSAAKARFRDQEEAAMKTIKLEREKGRWFSGLYEWQWERKSALLPEMTKRTSSAHRLDGSTPPWGETTFRSVWSPIRSLPPLNSVCQRSSGGALAFGEDCAKSSSRVQSGDDGYQEIASILVPWTLQDANQQTYTEKGSSRAWIQAPRKEMTNEKQLCSCVFVWRMAWRFDNSIQCWYFDCVLANWASCWHLWHPLLHTGGAKRPPVLPEQCTALRRARRSSQWRVPHRVTLFVYPLWPQSFSSPEYRNWSRLRLVFFLSYLRVVGDNLDFHVGVRQTRLDHRATDNHWCSTLVICDRVLLLQMRLDHRATDNHWFNMLVICDRVLLWHLDATKPVGDLVDISISPTQEELHSLHLDLATLAGRVLCKNFHFLRPFRGIVDPSIPCKYAAETQQKSAVASLVRPQRDFTVTWCPAASMGSVQEGQRSTSSLQASRDFLVDGGARNWCSVHLCLQWEPSQPQTRLRNEHCCNGRRAACSSRMVVEILGRIGHGGSYPLLKQQLKSNTGAKAKVPDDAVKVVFYNEQRLLKSYLTSVGHKVKLDIIKIMSLASYYSSKTNWITTKMSKTSNWPIPQKEVLQSPAACINGKTSQCGELRAEEADGQIPEKTKLNPVVELVESGEANHSTLQCPECHTKYDKRAELQEPA